MQEHSHEAPAFDLFELMQDAVGTILDHEDYPSFIDWLTARCRDELESRALNDGRQGRGLASVLGRQIWNATPLPSNDWRPKPIPAPGRNDPCPCSSGKKFKQCCARLDHLPAVEPDEIWAVIVGALTPDELDRLVAAKRIPLGCMGAAAEAMLDDHRPEDAIRLLAPLFAPPFERLDERLLDALDTLTDAHLMQGGDDARIALLESIHRMAPRLFRAEAAQRLASIYADLGDGEKAWECFHSAVRNDPDSPGAAVLELTLLASEQRNDEAKDRARFWLHRLGKLDGMPPEVLDLLRRASSDPERALATVDLSARGLDVERITAVLAALGDRPIANEYQIVLAASQPAMAEGDDVEASMRDHLRKMGVPADGIEASAQQIADDLRRVQQKEESAVPASASDADVAASEDTANYGQLSAPALADIERRWHAVFPSAKLFAMMLVSDDDPWPASPAWLDFLESEPRAADSLDVLDDIATALESRAVGEPQWADRMLIEPIEGRAWRIFAAAMNAAPADTAIPWGIVDNRPALRLAARYCFVLYRLQRYEDAMAIMEPLLRWNPDDNHGLRAVLANAYLERSRWDAALLLCARYPDDATVEIAYGRCLAHFAKGEIDAAQAALRVAVRMNKHVPRVLTRIADPEDDAIPVNITPGSEDEALQYRDEAITIWDNVPGAIEWLKGAAPARAHRRRR
ncbi:MAG: tetratricopeptide repeat protein [Burkholderiales bacterium]